MRKIYSFIICLGLFQMTFGQIPTNYNAKWFFGVNTGTTWQTTDVQNKNNWGWGLTLGKSFNYHSGALVSFDVRGRFLKGFWYGQDRKASDFSVENTTLSQSPLNYKDSLGFAVHNFQTENYMFNLELVAHLNRLRERTRWDAYIFGGIGLNWNQTYGDYLQTNATTGDKTMYGWSANDISASYLKNLQDGVYETALDGSNQNSYNFHATSSLGFGLGYQVGKAVTIGLEHKTSFSNYDQFDGYAKNSKFKQDLFHYTNAYIQIRLFGKNTYEDNQTHTNPNNPNPVNQNVPPVVTFTEPYTSGKEVSAPNYIVQAKINNVFDNENITFTHNGVYNNKFIYNINSDLFSSEVVLQPGQNLFELSGTNQYGTDTKTTIVIYKRETETPPVVSFQRPGTNPLTVNNANFNVIGRILNVKTKDQVVVKVNGQNVSNFTFNTSNGQVDFPVVLHVGSNNVQITGTNSAGTDSKSTTIIYKEIPTVQPPAVYFTDPATTPTKVANANFVIRGKILNVDGNSGVVFKQNGTARTNFTYNPTTDDFVCNVVLTPGQNIFELYGTNTAGTASANTVLNFEREIVVKNPPIVTISNPNVSPSNTNSANYSFAGTVLNVNAKSQIELTLNGVATTAFTFNSSSNGVLANLNLITGSNIVGLKGTNVDGSDSKQVIIVYTPTQTLPAPVVTYITPANNPLTVSTSSYGLQATVTNVGSQSGVNVVCNGQNVSGFTFNNGLVSFNQNLIQGANVVTVTGSNTTGSDSKTTTIYYQPQATVLPPVVTFVVPGNSPTTVNAASYSIQATVTNVSSQNDISVKINGSPTNNFTYSATSKLVTFTTALVVGANFIEIKGTNSAGTDSKSSTIIYAIPAPQTPPTVNIIQPSTSPITVNNAPYTILADFTEVTNPSQVSMKVNGTTVSGYNINLAQQRLTFGTTLVEGNNLFEVKVTTSTGTATDQTTIVYQKPVLVLPPTITFTAPSTAGTTVSNNQFTMVAKVLRIDTKQQVILKKDGQLVSANLFAYTASNYTISYPLTLSNGNNLFEVIATNDGGTISANTTIIYVPEVVPCNKPVVTATNNESLVMQANYTFQFGITNVTSQNVQFILNGTTVNGTSSNNSSFSVPVVLNSGNNVLQVVANNNCGSTSFARNIVYRAAEVPCNKPVISPIVPTAQISNTTSASAIVQVASVNVENSSQVSVKLNGNSIPFTFDQAQKVISATMGLQVGNNSIVITATTSCGSATYTYTITRINCVSPSLALLYSNVANNQNTYAANAVLTLSTTEIDNQNQLEVLLNNKPIAFNYSNTTNILEVNYAINVGLAQFKIIATNACGTKQYLHNITRLKSPARELPTVSITNPSGPTLYVNSSIYNLQFATTNIIDAAELIVQVNGQLVNFTFDKLTNSGSSTINLVSGGNMVTVTAVNQAGSAVANATLIYTAGKQGTNAPVIQFLSPATSPSNINLGINRIKGQISNVGNLNSVQIKVNGTTVNRVTKKIENEMVTFEFDLNAVVNQPVYIVEVLATNQEKSEIKTIELRLNQEQIKERIETPIRDSKPSNPTTTPIRRGK